MNWRKNWWRGLMIVPFAISLIGGAVYCLVSLLLLWSWATVFVFIFIAFMIGVITWDDLD